MRALVRSTVIGLAIAGTVVSFGTETQAATCVNKAAQGTNNTRDGAMFQAWEAVLQATDWGSWSSFMASGAKIGTAPGYKVSNVKSSCKPGGIGFECVMQAKLCK